MVAVIYVAITFDYVHSSQEITIAYIFGIQKKSVILCDFATFQFAGRQDLRTNKQNFDTKLYFKKELVEDNRANSYQV